MIWLLLCSCHGGGGGLEPIHPGHVDTADDSDTSPDDSTPTDDSDTPPDDSTPTDDSTTLTGWPDEIDLSASPTRYLGDSPDDQVGGALAGTVDATGDGVRDLMIGIADSGSPGGIAYLVSGTFTGDVALGTSAQAQFTGALGDDAGRAVASADLDGDAAPDFLVGAPGHDDAKTPDTGAVYVVLGPISGTVDLASADGRGIGPLTNELAGSALVGGDLDDDGFPDLLVGAPGSSHAYFVAGPITGDFVLAAKDSYIGDAPDDQFGSVVSVGDVDGDGVSDVLFGSPGAEQVYLVQGPKPDGLVPASKFATATFSAPTVGAVAEIVGDVDGDGTDDIVLGAAGAAYVWTGSPTGTLDAGKGSAILDGSDPSFGRTVAGVGRVDSTATTEGIAIGATDAVFLFLETPVGVVAAEDAVSVSGPKSEGVGEAIAGTGDVTGDGTGDLVIGAPRADVSAVDAGVVYLLPGI